MSDKTNNDKTTYIVDLPTKYGIWEEFKRFDTREEAVKFIQEVYGGDDNGMISLITEVDL